jgi:hypothetical protein
VTVSSAATDTPGSSAPAVPEAYLGQWSGTVTSNTGAEGPQTATLKLIGGPVNSIVGTASYTNGPCTYNLSLVSASGSEVELQEQVTSGPCFSDNAIVKLDGARLTEDVYLFSLSGSPDLTGTLAKTS